MIDLDAKYPCPCCGFVVHENIGQYQICPICGWEDDPVQLRWPSRNGGANSKCLIEAQTDFIEVYEERGDNRFVRERNFRTIDTSIDRFEEIGTREGDWPEDRSELYWWRPTFWRIEK